ncbi:TIGR04255 family protein [bacterium]|nr:TIGR04255 family protein [bacterium]
MAISEEVFVNPTVKQVIFQIRYPNLFFIDARIGKFQIEIMKAFPKSKLIISKQFLLVDFSKDADLGQMKKDAPEDSSNRIWEFEAENGDKLHVSRDSLSLTSKQHKTYNNPNSDMRFRDLIKSILKHFIDITDLPIVSRVGLRYIDECPVPSWRNSDFRKWYKSCLPLARFSLDTSTLLHTNVTVQRGQLHLTYKETLRKTDDPHVLHMDIDGFSVNVDSDHILTTTDAIHALISKEYFKTIKEPVLEYMRKKKED